MKDNDFGCKACDDKRWPTQPGEMPGGGLIHKWTGGQERDAAPLRYSREMVNPTTSRPYGPRA
jgi:hypothetical protein